MNKPNQAKWQNKTFPFAHEPKMEYETVDDLSFPAIGSLTTGQHVRMWTLERGSKRELLFLAFMAEFMTEHDEEEE